MREDLVAGQPEVWILAERRSDELHSSTYELIAEGRNIADKMRESLGAVLLGHDLSGVASLLAESSVDRVHVVDHPTLAAYTTDAFTWALTQVVREHQPSILLLAATPNGSDLAPRLATRLQTSLVTGCIRAKPGDECLLELTKPLCDDKVYATVRCQWGCPPIVTMRPGVIGTPRVPSTPAPILQEAIEIPSEAVRTRVVRQIPADPKELSLQEAELIVAGGRGIKQSESWRLVEELADALDASVGGSRMAVDAGWIPLGRQVGQTGHTVAPKLYFTLGISGAPQHVGGVKSTKGIVAINKDKKAPIFQIANLKVVADLHEVVPALTARLRELKKPADGSSGIGAGE